MTPLRHSLRGIREDGIVISHEDWPIESKKPLTVVALTIREFNWKLGGAQIEKAADRPSPGNAEVQRDLGAPFPLLLLAGADLTVPNLQDILINRGSFSSGLPHVMRGSTKART